MSDRTFYVEDLTKLSPRMLEAFIEGWENLRDEAKDYGLIDEELMAEWNLDQAAKEKARRAKPKPKADPELDRLLGLLDEVGGNGFYEREEDRQKQARMEALTQELELQYLTEVFGR